MPAEKYGMVTVAALAFAAMSATGLSNVRVGLPPPDFIVQTPDGNIPLSRLRGKPVVINFWASWCPPCTDELPYFERIEKLYGNRVTVVTVSNEAPGVAKAYLAGKRYALPLVEDPKGDIFREYSIPPIPDTVVLNAAGKVVYVSVGGLSWNELESAVARAVADGGA